MSEIISVDGGWAEVLYHRAQPVRFSRLEELKEEDYQLVGSPVPLRELDLLNDLLVMVREERFDGLPRKIAHGDVLQIVAGGRTPAARSYAVVDVDRLKATFQGGNYRLEIAAGQRLGMIKLPTRFSSFWVQRSLA
jgi:hypothetical protein